MRALLLLVLVIVVGVPVAMLDAAPVPKEIPRPLLLDCTGPKGADARTVRASQLAWAKSLGEKSHEKTMALDQDGKVLIEMVLVPPGKYYRGSAEGTGTNEERPQKVITISKPMWVGKYEVTQSQYMSVTGKKNPSRFAKVGADAAKYPVERVNHDEALAFCQATAGGKFRLLTEAQWEYSYRAGTRLMWYSGDDEKSVGEIARCVENSHKATVQVGSKTANAFGLHDMAGNVCEWCSDWYDSDAYADSPTKDPTGPESGSMRINRGGNWNLGAEHCRAALRFANGPEGRFSTIGFRVCVIVD